MKKRGIVLAVLVCALCMAGCARETNPEPEECKVEKEDVEEAAVISEEQEEAEEEKPVEEETDEKNIIIAIDPGHQGWDIDMSAQEPNAPGSDVMKAKATSGTAGRYSGVPEYQLNMDISLLLRARLEELGYDVIMTREDNETAISNSERAILANQAGADVSVRIHANGSEDPSVSGALALITSPNNPYTGGLYEESYRLAEQILDSYCRYTGFVNRGIQENDTMTGINWSQIPVVILEMGFMSNENDDLQMADEAFREKMVAGIVDGIEKYYGN